jgi:hypothetical protein
MSVENENGIGALDAESAVDRVITQDEVKLYRFSCVLAHLDGPVYDFSSCTLRLDKNPMPVYSDDMKQIGFASVEPVRLATHKIIGIKANVSIDYSTEERLLLETHSVKLYPRVFGAMSVGNMAVFDFQRPLTPMTLRIDGIQVSRNRPQDQRIDAIGWAL